MKNFAWTSFLSIAFAASAIAGSLDLEAHETGTADGTYTNWSTDYGIYDRDFRRRKRIIITVRDFSRKVPSVMVHVYFIGHPMGNTGPLFVYGDEEASVELHGNLEVTGEVDAPPLDANIRNYAALGVAYVSGADIDGWIVIGEFEGNVFQTRASRQVLLDLANNQPETLQTMVAAY